ncbi:MAG: hypothetical protein OEQ29_07995 [Alphaproteobacteria bacterium]|nr:hypothetical protein [Alphaproteobacteria bacterium]
MRDFAEIEAEIAALGDGRDPAGADALMSIGEEILERWIAAGGGEPTKAVHEGFRLLALQRQGARGKPSFNACRETCRELVYHRNLIALDPGHPNTLLRLKMASLVAMHLLLFVSGKLEAEGLGEFCCASRPLRAASQ